MDWAYTKEGQPFTKSHVRKTTRQGNLGKEKNWDAVWLDRKRRLLMSEENSRRKNNVEDLDK